MNDEQRAPGMTVHCQEIVELVTDYLRRRTRPRHDSGGRGTPGALRRLRHLHGTDANHHSRARQGACRHAERVSAGRAGASISRYAPAGCQGLVCRGAGTLPLPALTILCLTSGSPPAPMLRSLPEPMWPSGPGAAPELSRRLSRRTARCAPSQLSTSPKGLRRAPQ